MGKLSIAVVSVDVEDAAISEAVMAGLALIEQGLGLAMISDPPATAEIPPRAAEEIEAAAVAARGAGNRRVSAAVKAVQAGAGRIVCPDCGRPYASKQGLGKHRSAAHGISGAFRQLESGKSLPCGVNGCLKEFRNGTRRQKHWEKAHAPTSPC